MLAFLLTADNTEYLVHGLISVFRDEAEKSQQCSQKNCRKAMNNKINNTPIATNQYAIKKTTSFCFLVDSGFGGGCISILFIHYPEGKPYHNAS